LLRTDGFVVSPALHGTVVGNDTSERDDQPESSHINAVDHAETDDHGTCSLPRHTIRERID
jgi:hypothetical protein